MYPGGRNRRSGQETRQSARLSDHRTGHMLSKMLFQDCLRPECVLTTEECSLGGDG